MSHAGGEREGGRRSYAATGSYVAARPRNLLRAATFRRERVERTGEKGERD